MAYAPRVKSPFRILGGGVALCLATPAQEKAVVDFVKKWRNKRFCTRLKQTQQHQQPEIPRRQARYHLGRYGSFPNVWQVKAAFAQWALAMEPAKGVRG